MVIFQTVSLYITTTQFLRQKQNLLSLKKLSFLIQSGSHFKILQMLNSKCIIIYVIMIRILTTIRMYSLSKFNPQKDYYKVLNLASSATQPQIKKSYIQLAKKYHPDANQGKQQLFKELNEAYQVLSSQDTKKQYDESRSSPRSQNRTTTQQQSTYRGYERQEDWNDQAYRDRVMDEIFKQQQQSNRRSRSHEETLRSRADKNFQEKYRQHAENIRRYNSDIKITQESIRKALEEEEKRRREEFEAYKENQKLDQMMEKKLKEMGDGLRENVEGMKRMGTYVKSFWKDLTKKK